MLRFLSPMSLIQAVTATVGIASSSVFFSSCGGHEEDTALTDVEVTTDTISSEVRTKFDMLRVNIPTPGKLIEKLSAAKIAYNKSFLIPSGKAGSFSTNYQKAVGIGALGADLSIAAAFNQSQDALELLNHIGKLAGDLGIGTAFDPEFSKQLFSNVSKPDTFQLMLDKAFDKAERNLRSNQRVATAILMVTGGWIESLHISVEALNTNPKGPNTKTLYFDISAHCQAFSYIFDLLDEYKSNADCAKLMQDMMPSKQTLLNIGKNPKIGPDDLPKIREIVTQLRTKVIG